MTDAPKNILIATVPKTSRENVHVQLATIHGLHVAGARVFYTKADGEWRPGKDGFAVQVKHLPALAAAFAHAEAKARELGWIGGDE